MALFSDRNEPDHYGGGCPVLSLALARPIIVMETWRISAINSVPLIALCSRFSILTQWNKKRPDRRRTQDAFGRYEHASLQVNFNMVPLDDAFASMRLFAEQVMPHFTRAE